MSMHVTNKPNNSETSQETARHRLTAAPVTLTIGVDQPTDRTREQNN